MSKCSPYIPGGSNLLPSEIVSLDNPMRNPYPTADQNILLVNPTANYTRPQIVDLVKRFNSILKVVDLSKYPLVRARITNTGNQFLEYSNPASTIPGIGPFDSAPAINYIEMSQFMNNYTYTFEQLENAISNYEATQDPDNGPFQQLLQDFNNNLNATGGCSIPSGLFGGIGNIFGKVREALDQLLNAFDMLTAIIQNFQQLIQGGIFDLLNNLINSLIQQGLGLLQSLFDQLMSMFDCVFGGIAQQVQSLTNLAAQTMQDLQFLGNSAMSRMGVRLRQLQEMASPQGQERLRLDAEEFLETAQAQFEVLTPDVIDFLGHRFTEFAEQAQQYMQRPVDEFRTLINNMHEQYRQIEATGLQNTALAVAMGATRLNPDEILNLRMRATLENWNSVLSA